MLTLDKSWLYLYKFYLKPFNFIVWLIPGHLVWTKVHSFFYVPGPSKDGQGFLQFGCKALTPLLNLLGGLESYARTPSEC